MADDEKKWSDSTDMFIDRIDQQLGSKYGVSLRRLLTNPAVIGEEENKKDIIEGFKKDVSSFFEGLLTSLDSERKDFEAQLEKTTEEYNKISGLLKEKSAALKIPYVNPLLIERDETNDETIIISAYNDSIGELFDKILEKSNFIADLSTDYHEYKIGSWLFSGQKNYVLTINQPSSVVLSVENSRDEILALLDSIPVA